MNELDDLLGQAIKERIKASPDAPGLDFVERRSAAHRRSRRIGLAAASVVLIAGGVFAASVWDGTKTRNVDTAAGEVLEAETEGETDSMTTSGNSEPEDMGVVVPSLWETVCGASRIVQLEELLAEEEQLLSELLALEDSDFIQGLVWSASYRNEDEFDLVATEQGSPTLVAYANFKRREGALQIDSWARCVLRAAPPEGYVDTLVIHDSASPDAGSTMLNVWVLDMGCDPENPSQFATQVNETAGSVEVTAFMQAGGPTLCLAGQWRRHSIELAAPFGDRQLVDASFVPGLVRNWPAEDELRNLGSDPEG